MTAIKLRNARRWKTGGWHPVLISLCGFATAFILRYVLSPVVDDAMSMLFFSINCIVISYFFGYVYSLGLLVISIPTALFFFRKPYLVMDGLGDKDVFLIVIYGSMVVLASIIIEWLQRERYSAVLQQRVSETRYQMLIESDQARRAEYAEHFAAAGKRQEEQAGAAGSGADPAA